MKRIAGRCLSLFMTAMLTVACADKANMSGGGQALMKGAILLFNGHDLSGWTTPNGKAPRWRVRDGYMEVVPGAGDIQTVAKFGDFQLHAEFWIPLLPKQFEQNRGNSGIFLQGRYEVQVLDSYQQEGMTYPDGVCGSLYKSIPPENVFSVVRAPETWQTYDIIFHSPRVDAAGKVTKPGTLTVFLNGTPIIHGGKFSAPTGSAFKEKQGVPGPIRLQDHGSAVRFRNLQLIPIQ